MPCATSEATTASAVVIASEVVFINVAPRQDPSAPDCADRRPAVEGADRGRRPGLSRTEHGLNRRDAVPFAGRPASDARGSRRDLLFLCNGARQIAAAPVEGSVARTRLAVRST